MLGDVRIKRKNKQIILEMLPSSEIHHMSTYIYISLSGNLKEKEVISPPLKIGSVILAKELVHL